MTDCAALQVAPVVLQLNDTNSMLMCSRMTDCVALQVAPVVLQLNDTSIMLMCSRMTDCVALQVAPIVRHKHHVTRKSCWTPICVNKYKQHK